MINKNHFYIRTNEILLRTYSDSNMYWLYSGPLDGRDKTNYRFRKISTAINFALKQIRNNKWDCSLETTLQLTKLSNEAGQNENKYIILSKQSKNRK